MYLLGKKYTIKCKVSVYVIFITWINILLAISCIYNGKTKTDSIVNPFVIPTATNGTLPYYAYYYYLLTTKKSQWNYNNFVLNKKGINN